MLGQVDPAVPLHNMPKLLHFDIDFSFLEAPFTHDEIDVVVKVVPSNKSPRPDGFNAEYLKKCWHIIKKDFYDLCEQFHNGTLCLESINSCFITLVPKRMMSLLLMTIGPSLCCCTLKLITKLLANRLQTIIQKLIHETNIVLSNPGQFKTVWHVLMSICTTVIDLKRK
jgi:hypothetical protein